jgi:hypothetical protein
MPEIWDNVSRTGAILSFRLNGRVDGNKILEKSGCFRKFGDSARAFLYAASVMLLVRRIARAS